MDSSVSVAYLTKKVGNHRYKQPFLFLFILYFYISAVPSSSWDSQKELPFQPGLCEQPLKNKTLTSCGEFTAITFRNSLQPGLWLAEGSVGASFYALSFFLDGEVEGQSWSLSLVPAVRETWRLSCELKWEKRESFWIGGWGERRNREVREFRDEVMYRLADLQWSFTCLIVLLQRGATPLWRSCELDDLGLKIVKLTNSEDEHKNSFLQSFGDIASKLSP